MFLFLQSVCESEKVVIAAADGLAPSARSRSSRSVRSSVVAPCRSDCSDTISLADSHKHVAETYIGTYNCPG